MNDLDDDPGIWEFNQIKNFINFLRYLQQRSYYIEPSQIDEEIEEFLSEGDFNPEIV